MACATSKVIVNDVLRCIAGADLVSRKLHFQGGLAAADGLVSCLLENPSSFVHSPPLGFMHVGDLQIKVGRAAPTEGKPFCLEDCRRVREQQGLQVQFSILKGSF